MGNGASIPELLDENMVRELAGSEYNQEVMNSLKNENGFITRLQFLDLNSKKEEIKKEDTGLEILSLNSTTETLVSPDDNADKIEKLSVLDTCEQNDPVLNEELRVACGKVMKGKKPSIQSTIQLVSRGAKPEEPDEDGWTALFYAAGDGLVEQLRFLMDECKINLDTVDTDGCSALWNAAYNNQRQTTTLLLSRGADLELKGVESGGRGGAIKAAMAARRNNNPGLADMLDAEARLRDRDSTRLPRLLTSELVEDEFLHSLKAEEVEPSK